jgi:hypothetical protein
MLLQLVGGPLHGQQGEYPDEGFARRAIAFSRIVSTPTGPAKQEVFYERARILVAGDFEEVGWVYRWRPPETPPGLLTNDS